MFETSSKVEKGTKSNVFRLETEYASMVTVMHPSGHMESRPAS